MVPFLRMNEPPFDLKFLPDWLKEEPTSYASHEGEPAARPRRDGRERNKDSPRERGPRQGKGKERRERPPAPQPQEPPADVAMEFLPESECLEALIRQIKAGSRAFPLFGLARVFLEKAERHRVRITAKEGAAPLWQCGEDGPVALDRRSLEKGAFTTRWERYYAKEVFQKEPMKGNYSNVARCRLSGTLLGPTNHHSYQSALRSLYEERFQRRMPFQEFLREIETVSDPKLVEEWKENARSSVRYTTTTEPEPLQFDSAALAEEHFRKTYLEREARSGQTFEIPGPVSRELPDPRIAAAVRQEWEKERKFPVLFSRHLRRRFTDAGLHVFKYHKRVLFASAIRPTRLKAEGVTDGVREILDAIRKKPRCNRSQLAAAVLQGKPDEEKLKAALAGDLRWLIHAGHVVEFHDGTLDLPIEPKPEPAVARPVENARGATAAPPVAADPSGPALP